MKKYTPEQIEKLHLYLAFENEALRATAIFLDEQGFPRKKVLEIVAAADQLLAELDKQEQNEKEK